MCLCQLLVVAASGNDYPLDGVTVFIDCDYCIHSNLWNILIIGTQGLNYLILSNSWNESILTNKYDHSDRSNRKILLGFIFSSIMSLACATNSIHSWEIAVTFESPCINSVFHELENVRVSG